MAERLVPTRDLEDAFLLVGPGPVPVDHHVDPVAESAEGLVEERVGQDPVDLGTARRRELELGGIGLRLARCQQRLGPRDAEREGHRSGFGLPEPIAHLVVERLGVTGLCDVGVVPQAIEELRPVGLAIDRLQLVALDEQVSSGPLQYGVLVGAFRPLPHTGHRAQGSEVRQRVRVAVRLGVDVGSVYGHSAHLAPLVCSDRDEIIGAVSGARRTPER